MSKVKILGHQRDENGIRPSEDKLGQFREWPVPTTKDELMRFVYMLPFLKAFIPGRADHSTVMKSAIVEEKVTIKQGVKQSTTSEVVDFRWSAQHQRAFDAVKQPVLENACSGGDDDRQYHLCTDASKTGLGGVLFQLRMSEPGTPMNKDLWADMSIELFLSFQLTPAQSRYHTTEREALAVVKALAEVRWIVKGSKVPIMLYTDHQALLKTLQSKDATGRISRWQLALSEYDLNIYHVPGSEIAIADGLSRIEGYPSVKATDFENTMASFAAEEGIGNPATEGHPEETPDEGWEDKWQEWLEDPWYQDIIEYKFTGPARTELTLQTPGRRVTRHLASKFILVDNGDLQRTELAYVERNGKHSRCIHKPQVAQALFILHNVHGHFSEGITYKRSIGKFFWPTRQRDINVFCRTCHNCQMIGPLKPRSGLLPVVSLQPMDCLGYDQNQDANLF